VVFFEGQVAGVIDTEYGGGDFAVAEVCFKTDKSVF
jgi:hypothetical protein